MNEFIRFSLLLLFLLVVSFGLHLTALNLKELPLFENKIILAYLVNYFLAVLIYGILYFLQHRMTAHLGFLFMGGSFIKFIVFFILFHPSYKIDGSVSSSEFAAFFVPYAISLVIETLGIIKFLKK